MCRNFPVNSFIVVGWGKCEKAAWFLECTCSSCSHLLGGVLRLRATGLSYSGLSCLLFIAGLLYLLDPVFVCMHIHTCLHLHVCFGKCATTVCVALIKFIITITVLLST